MQQQRPYGTWPSPIGSDEVVAESLHLGAPCFDGDAIYWLEGRPAEGGRVVLVRRDADGGTRDVVPAPYSVRSQVHEYGEGAYCVHAGTIWFSNFEDRCLYEIRAGAAPRRLRDPDALRFADLSYDPRRRRLVCVCEDHAGEGEARNSIVAVATASGELTTLARGFDFYSNPRLDPTGKRLAWICWRHPNMPWDSTELWVAHLGEHGQVVATEQVAAGEDDAVIQPQWGPDGRLFFVSDRSDWWNLYVLERGRVRAVTNEHAELGMPQWVFGMSNYAFADRNSAYCALTRHGRWRLATLDIGRAQLAPLDLPYASIEHVAASGDRALLLAGATDRPTAVVLYDAKQGTTEELRRSTRLEIDRGTLSVPEAVEFATTADDKAYGFYYAPRNAKFTGPDGELPPLLVICHGGPTASTTVTLKPAIQYWTSRGIAVLDVNYRGSTGYGRSYRRKLCGNWGLYDSDDCLRGALAMAERGLADRDRLIIRGGSAGGYTVLCALTRFEVFSAGASYYGISDLASLAAETHKFESRYVDVLIGDDGDLAKRCEQRSPRNYAEQMRTAAIFFQGALDKAVPPDQARGMVAALRRQGVPVAYLEFPAEGHGFRDGKTLRTCLESELSFYLQILDIAHDPDLPAVAIENLANERIGSRS